MVVAAACGGNANPFQAGPAPFPQACRTYASQWTETSSFGVPTTASASFSRSDHVLSEMSPAGSTQIVRQTTYASDADFIDEPGVVGRALYLKTATCPSPANCSSGLAEVETPSYDADRRQTGVRQSVNGATLVTETYTAWDASGRPIAGARVQPGLCTVNLIFAYDDVARSVTVSPSGANGILCLGLSYQTMRTYDANGNLLTDTGAAGGTSTTSSRTIDTTAQLCK